MNVMITGCAGFIGSHAVDLFLDLGYCVTGIDSFTYAGKPANIIHHNKNKNFKCFNVDICNTAELSSICSIRNVEWIINFAAETHVDNSINDVSHFVHSNIRGVISLLEVCREFNIPIFHISTDEVYGSTQTGTFEETDILSPQNPYSASKAAAEYMVKAFHNTHGVQYLMVRPSNNFGPRQHDEKFLPTILRSLLDSRQIPVYGNGKNIREWLYVKDTCASIEFILRNSNKNETYNISSNDEMQNLELVELVCGFMNAIPDEAITYVKDRPGHDFRYSISSKKINDLGMLLSGDFRKNMKETITWYVDKWNNNNEKN